MRKLALVASLLATSFPAALSAPAFAHSRPHIAMPAHAADFVGLAPTSTAPAGFERRFDPTSPNLNADPHPCIWAVACTY